MDSSHYDVKFLRKPLWIINVLDTNGKHTHSEKYSSCSAVAEFAQIPPHKIVYPIVRCWNNLFNPEPLKAWLEWSLNPVSVWGISHQLDICKPKGFSMDGSDFSTLSNFHFPFLFILKVPYLNIFRVFICCNSYKIYLWFQMPKTISVLFYFSSLMLLFGALARTGRFVSVSHRLITAKSVSAEMSWAELEMLQLDLVWSYSPEPWFQCKPLDHLAASGWTSTELQCPGAMQELSAPASSSLSLVFIVPVYIKERVWLQTISIYIAPRLATWKSHFLEYGN